ncbi:DUF833-domain-containing protein [Backusella circina FSU 941]|nr:DUF833-domain-containing protein [Backusella circina FSU 941]
MCILFWTTENHPKYRFIFAGNRDEFLDRDTAKADFWNAPHDNVLAGMDLDPNIPLDGKQGTWLGITRQGKFSALTNYREHNFKGNRSRGVVVRDYLWDTTGPLDYLQDLSQHGSDFGGFNIICASLDPKKEIEVGYYSNREDSETTLLQYGEYYGLSNSTLGNPWVKVEKGKQVFKDIVAKDRQVNEETLIEDLFNLLRTTEEMTDVTNIQQVFADLKERICVPLFNFINGAYYATRTSTVVLVDYDGRVTFVERDWYNKDKEPITCFDDADRKFSFNIEP